MTMVLLVVIKCSVIALLGAVGMGSTASDLTYLLRRPALLLRSLFAMYVAMPLAALVIVQTIPLRAGIRTAILVLAYLVSAAVVTLPYLKVRAKYASTGAAAPGDNSTA